MKHLLVTLLTLAMLGAMAQSNRPKELNCTETTVTFKFNFSKNLHIDKMNLGNQERYRPQPQPTGNNLIQDVYHYPILFMLPETISEPHKLDTFCSSFNLFKCANSGLPDQHIWFKNAFAPYSKGQTRVQTLNTGNQRLCFPNAAF
jgi:hypothetical protein